MSVVSLFCRPWKNRADGANDVEGVKTSRNRSLNVSRARLQAKTCKQQKIEGAFSGRSPDFVQISSGLAPSMDAVRTSGDRPL